MSRTRKVDGRYLLPSVVDPDRKCFQIWIPNEDNHIRAWFAAINELRKAWVWKWDEDKIGSAVGFVWGDAIDTATADFYLGGCMNCNYCYFDLSNTIETYITNISTVNTWVDAFTTSGGVNITTQVSSDIKYSQGHDVATDAQICLAVDLFIDALCEGAIAAHASGTDTAIDRLNNILVNSAAAFMVAAVLFPPSIAIVANSVALGAAIGAVLTQILPGLITTPLAAALADEEARREMKCCMFNVLSAVAAIASWPTWQGLFKGLVACPTAAMSDNGKLLRTWMQGIVSPSSELYVAFYRQLDDWGLLAYEDDLPLCTVCGDWCYRFDFTAGDQGWSIWTEQPYGEYVAATGWQSTFSANYEQMFIILEDDKAVANRVRLDWICSGTGTHIPRSISVTLTRGGLEVYEAAVSTMDFDADGEAGYHVFEPDSVEYDRIRITFTAESSSGSINMLVTYCEVGGIGPNPYGADNC
jgi:hypothetical protein